MRQPWAWAIIDGCKMIENRTKGSIKSGGMDLRRIAIHAASGMTEKEYRWAVWRMQKEGVRVPRPEALARSAIIGTVDVVDIVTRETCPEPMLPWFGGPCGLVLEDPVAINPLPAKGALGYFEWHVQGTLAPAKPWMLKYDTTNGDRATLDLFGKTDQTFETEPERPFGSGAK